MLSTLIACALVAVNPATEVADADADIATVQAEARLGIRYLSVYNIEQKDRANVGRAIDHTLNVLSRYRVIGHAKPIGDHLYRFSIVQFAPKDKDFKEWATAWDKLGQADPWFHLQTEVLVDAKANKRAVKSVLGGWTGLPVHQSLARQTGTDVPILRADYFIYMAMTAPAYYEFSGVPATEKEFVKSLGIDQEVIDALRANAGANLFKSNVTNKPRRIIWSQGPLGGYYQTLDVEEVDAARDPIRRPVTDEGLKLDFDATEIFAMGPNGFWRVALYDKNGKLQQVVPDKIAKDTSDPHSDGRVVPAISCYRCHKEGGLRPFKDDQSTLLFGQISLNSYKPNVVQRAAEFYDPKRLARQIKFDRETYEEAVVRATGLSAVEYADTLLKVYGAYEAEVTPEVAAKEAGFATVADFKRVMASSNDPIILQLAINGRNVLRNQWASSFQEAALAAQSSSNPRQR